LLERGFLAGVRRRAMRRGIWFRALSDLDRGILNLSAVLLDDVRSVTLRVQIVSILAKLRDAFKSPFRRYVEKHGQERLRQVLEAATKLGCSAARSLQSDEGFMEYLMFLDFHQPIGWSVYPRGV
jgi:hypothetical protein